ncbi:PucR family transcriptional regulator [Pseudonocardia acidicola]|uniref:PucR family transcriptional regulator n=1 Tax=Pseudonocardia acidicola TaxID=2724939 RepID=A0ABX1SLJ6_9PSEU|nr:helix-turn-helix domain-containing protein [Pseudonocardia acidicola]NMI01150.1 PucR family transcriptional regulator [Pseudonocardia acidicola]
MDAQTHPVVLVARAMLPHRERFIAELTAETEQEIAVLDHDERLGALLEASIAENIVTAMHVLMNDIDPHTVDAPSSATSYARRLAQRDVPLSALLRAYRLGQAKFLDTALSEAVRLNRADTSETMIALVNVVAVYIDRVCEQVARAYEEERERWVSSRGVLRQHWITQLLHDPSPDIRQAETALGYRLGRTHLAVEGWIDRATPPDDVMGVFDRLTSVLQKVLAARGPALSVPTDERDVRIWFPVAADQDLDAGLVARELDGARLPVRVALGSPRPGLDGFRRSLRNASRAKKLAVSAGENAPRAVAFGQIAPVALLADEPQELADFVADTLGDLALDDRRQEGLRETLRLFLATNRSYVATAEQLMVHRNTVHYRIQQIVEKYLPDLDRDPLELQLALTICRWFGATVLRRPGGGGASHPNGH